MPRQPNNTTAVGMWNVTRPNQQRNAHYGERWPMMPPNYATGYVSRTSYLTSGDANPASTGIGTWGGHYVNAYYYQAISMRCTSHDWELLGWGGANSSSTQGLVYYDFKVWEGQYVNDPSKEISTYASAQAMWIPNNGSPSGQSMMWANGWFNSLGKLTQNTWYTLGMAYTQTSTQSYHGFPTFYLNGSGYGNYLSSTSMTSSASNAAGTTTITSDWEWASTLGLNTSSGWFLADMGTTSLYNGQFMTCQVRVF